MVLFSKSRSTPKLPSLSDAVPDLASKPSALLSGENSPLLPLIPPKLIPPALRPQSSPSPASDNHHASGLEPNPQYTPGLTNSADQSCSDVSTCFDDVVTLIDREEYPARGNQDDVFDNGHQAVPPPTDRSLSPLPKRLQQLLCKSSDKDLLTAAALSARWVAKVELYENSKLPLALPPFSLRGSSWPAILRLAAQCSLRVYSPPEGAERHQTVAVPRDKNAGARAMYVRTVPADAARAVVVAIRGTASFADWAVNLRVDPVSPLGFLDDAGNACHAGFLSVARAMAGPVARRLREILTEDPLRGAHALVFTGHSAGGAVAALLYMNMLATAPEARTELTELAASFRRVHCITFGAPPVSLLPLTRPDRPTLRDSLFLSFVNEGDPVARADKAFVKSLFALLRSPAPTPTGPENNSSNAKKKKPKGNNNKDIKYGNRDPPFRRPPIWPMPAATLSNAGRIVIFRCPEKKPAAHARREERDDVVAVTCRDDQLRGVVWGDAACHLMRLYAARVESLAATAEMATKHKAS